MRLVTPTPVKGELTPSTQSLSGVTALASPIRWKHVIIPLAVLTLTGTASLAVLHLPPVQQAVFSFLASRARASAGTSMQASDFRFNLPLGTLDIKNFALLSDVAVDLPPLATIESISVRFNPLRLPRGLSAIESVKIQNLSLQPVVSSDGRTNFPESKSSTRLDWNSLPSKITIEEASLHYRNIPHSLQLELPRLRCAISGNSGGRDLDLTTLAPGRLAFKNTLLTVDEIHLSGKLISSDLEIRSLTARVPGMIAEGHGRIRNLDDPSYELSFKSNVSLGDAWKLVGGQDPLSGTASLEASLSGQLGRLEAKGDLQAEDVRLAGVGPWFGQASLHYDQAGSMLTLSGLSANSAAGALTASGAMSLQAKQGNSALKIDARDLDIYQLMTRLGWAPAIGGIASGAAGIAWEGNDWRAARLEMDLNVTPRESRDSGRSIPLGGSLKLVRERQNLALNVTGIHGPGFHLDGDLRFNSVTDELRGEFAGSVDDGAAVISAARRIWPSAMVKFQVPIDGAVRWNARVDGPPKRPHVTAKVDSASLHIGRISDIGFTGTVEYDGGLWKFADIDAAWQGQEMRLSGEVNTNSSGSPSLSLKAGFDDAALGALMAPLALGVPVTGRLSGHLTAEGTFAEPVAEGKLECEDLQALGENLGALAAGFRLHGTWLAVDQLQLEKPQETGNGRLEASGSLDWEADSLRFRATGTGLRLDSMALPDGTGIRGVFSFEAGGETSLSDPAWTARLDGAEVSFAEQKVGTVRGALAAQGSRAQISFELPDFSATLRGEMGLRDPFTIAITAESAGIGFNRLGVSTVQDIPVGGSVAGRIDVAGPLSSPADLTAKGFLRDFIFRFGDHEVRGAEIGVEWKGRTLTVVPASLSSGHEALKIGGSLPLSGSGTGDVLSIDGTLPVSLLPLLVPSFREIEAKGTLQIRGSLRGSIAQLAPDAVIACNDGELRIPGLKTPLTSIVTDVHVNPDAIEVRRLDASLAGGTISALATLPISALSIKNPSGTMRGRVELKNIDPAILADIPGGLTGNISLQAEMEAPRPELHLIRGKIRFPELTLKARESEAAQLGETLLRIGDGQLFIDHFELKGKGTALRATGSASLLENGTLNLKIAGTSDAQLLNLTGAAAGVSGTVDLGLEVGGTVREPLVSGNVDLEDGRFILTTPPLVVENLRGHAEFTGTRATLTGLSGQVNGGSLTAEGGFSFNRDGVKDLRIQASANNLFLDYPKGLHTASNIDLEARSEGTSFLIGGTVQILEGEHREAINLQTLKAAPISKAGPNPLLERIRLNVQIRTTSPVSVDNNLARVDAYADLRLSGTASRPALLGRLELDEGGRVYIAERVFAVTRAVVIFTNENTIEPTLDLNADTRIGEYIVTINAAGGLNDMEASFTSDPAATQEQIYSLLLTGSVDNTENISSGNLLSRQALSLFGSSMMGSFNMRVRRALGVSDFRIEPSLISPDSDPTARLTIGQSFTPELRLTYSTNLQNSNDYIWIGEYDWRRTLEGRYVSQTEDTDRGELRHKLRFGGGDATGDIRSTRRKESVRLESFDVDGDLALPREVILKELELKAGQKYDFIDVQKRIAELTRFYANRGYLEMRLRQERERDEDGRSVRLKLWINAGRPVVFSFQGIDLPKQVREQVAGAWQNGVVDAQRLQEASTLVRRHLIRERFCDVELSTRVEGESDAVRKIVFDIVPGPRYERVTLSFEGSGRGLAKELRSVLRKAQLDTESTANPEAVQREVSRHLEGLGYLSADVSLPRVERRPESGSYESVIRVITGPRYDLGSLQFEGNAAISDNELRKILRAKTGDRYLPNQREDFTRSLQEFYYRRGYREATIETVEQRRTEAGTIDLRFHINENRLSVIAGIEVEGNVKTGEEFLRRRISLTEGQPADGEKLDKIRRRLFNSGTYSMVDLTLQPAAGESAAPSTEATATRSPARRLDLKLRVREPKPFNLTYGVTYDTSRGAGVIFDFSNRNILGEGRYLGYRILLDDEERNQRVYFSQPFLGRSDISTTLDLTSEDRLIDDLRIDERSATIQQQVEFSRRFTFSYGYRFQVADSTVVARAARNTESGTTSSILSTLIRDTRDDVFDATQGSYTSHSFQVAPESLGGSQGYTRYFGQYFRYFGLTRPDRAPFHEVSRPRFIFATGVRAGLINPLGDSTVNSADLFFGGGGSTIRGFAQNDLGPKDLSGQPIGGQSLFFLNIELRTPLFKLLDAAAFSDIGNVWAKHSDFSLSDLRKTAGIGIRIRNPFIMLRFDYGWKLDRRPFESKGAFHFSLGQAF